MSDPIRRSLPGTFGQTPQSMRNALSFSGGSRNARFEGLFAVTNRWPRGISFLSFGHRTEAPHRNRRPAGPPIFVLPGAFRSKNAAVGTLRRR
jgi:hypothetical protein